VRRTGDRVLVDPPPGMKKRETKSYGGDSDRLVRMMPLVGSAAPRRAKSGRAPRTVRSESTSIR
jgi:hypothetical protein